MKLKKHNKLDLNPQKNYRQQFNPHNKRHEKQVVNLKDQNVIQPCNDYNNYEDMEVPYSLYDNVSNKVFYARRRDKYNAW